MINFPTERAVRNPWASMPDLSPETELKAAKATIEFLKRVKGVVLKHLEDLKVNPNPCEDDDVHEVVSFSEFDDDVIDFLLATLGEGEVKITLCDGEVKTADTAIPGIWRMQTGRNGEVNEFIIARIPRAVLKFADMGLERVPDLVNPGLDVFAAPAILKELDAVARETPNAYEAPLADSPVFSIELTKQPMSPGDERALLSTLGRGRISVEMNGFARTTFIQTNVRHIWHCQVFNDLGKVLLNSFVASAVPPELPFAQEEFEDAARKIDETIAYLEADIARGAIGGGRRDV